MLEEGGEIDAAFDIANELSHKLHFLQVD